MLVALCRRLWNGNRVLPRGTCHRRNRHLSYRPWLEPLEARELPALPAGGLIAPALPDLVGTPYQTAGPLPGGAAPIHVTVTQNAPATVIDLGPVFAAIRGLQHEDGLRLAVLANTNSALIRTELSDSALTLTYRRDQCGTATVVVCATDADGVSVQQSLLITVRPLNPVGAVVAGPLPASPHLSTPLGIWR